MFQRKETSDNKFSSVYIIACLFKEAEKLTVYLLYVENQKRTSTFECYTFLTVVSILHTMGACEYQRL